MKKRRLILAGSLTILAICISNILIPQMRQGSLTGFRDYLMETDLEPYMNLLPLDSNVDEESQDFTDKHDELPEHFTYYYDTLPENEQLTYVEMYVILRDHKDFTRISTVDEDEVARIYQYIILDNPELYYVGTLQIESTKAKGNTLYIKVRANEIMTEEEQTKAKEKIDKFTSDFLEEVDLSWGNRKKARKAFEYIDEHATYVKGASYNQSMYSIVLGNSVCMGYTAAFKYLCDIMDVPCISLTGMLGSTNHAWNMIKCKKEWYYSDCTQGDDLVSEPERVDYKWFCIPKEELYKTHTVDNEELLPVAN